MGYIIFTVLFLFIIFFGLHISNKVDNFIELNENRINEKNKNKILIVGNRNLSQKIEKYFNTNNIKYDIIYDNNVKNLDNNYKCMLVIFCDDLDNLMICALSKRWYNIDSIISVYNDSENKIIFDKYGVTSIDIKRIYDEECLSMIKEKIKNA